jgi:hypothetical protein
MTPTFRVQTSLATIVMVTSAVLAAQTPKQPQAPDPLAAPVKVTATIEAIDRTAKLITLRGSAGQSRHGVCRHRCEAIRRVEGR